MKDKKTAKKKLKAFLTSMRLRVFLIILLAGLCMGCIIALTSHLVSKSVSIDKRIEQVKEYTDKLSAKLVSNVYFTSPANAPDITKELEIVAQMYEGRVMVTDSRLCVIFDSYGIEAGKTLISTEAIMALKGEKSEYRDEKLNLVELTIPVMDEQDSEGVNRGVLIISVSVKNFAELLTTLDKRLLLAYLLSAVVLVFFCIATASWLMQPFKQIDRSLHHVSEGYVADRVDIKGFSEIEAISDSFNEMLGRMAQLEDSRQEFVSNVSHELKTPMTSIKVLADSLLMQQDAPAEMYREFLTDINEEIDRENKIITDLLSLVKLDRKNGDMHVALVSINELLDIVIKRMRPIIQSAGIELIFESYREVSAEIDEVKLSLAITNLIENAVKYNRENGWIKITLDADHKTFAVTVTDSGIGIPGDELDKIFDRFYRVDKTRSRETGGTGLGLSIVKSVVLMHKGSFSVDSSEGEGTSFTIRIPLSYVNGQNYL